LQLQNKPLETQAMHAHKSLSVWNFNQNQVLDEETTNVKLSSGKTKKVMTTGGGVDGKVLYNWKRAKCGFDCFLLKLMTKHDLTKSAIFKCVHQGFFFFFSILWCSHHTGNHRQEVLAKFGYSSERKVEKFQHPDIFWQANGTYCDFKKKKNRQNLATTFSAFFSQKSFACCSGLFFRCQVAKFALN
jgi:hypothetical protein